MIYFDHNSTTPIAPEVVQAMMPYLTSEWGNPSSSYKFGSKLRRSIEESREHVAELIGCSPQEVIFTSGATESNNTAIQAALRATGKKHIITSAVEHPSVMNCCVAAEKSGCTVTYLPVDRTGKLALSELESAITSETALVSLMWANNETGVLFPVKEAAAVCKARGVLFHSDAAQAAGKTEIDMGKVHADYLSLTGHKFHAPKGIGILYARRKTPLPPLLSGGHQEGGRRAGTESVPLIVAIGAAARLTKQELHNFAAEIGPLRDALERGILSSVADTELNGDQRGRLANTTNITFHGVESEALLILLDQDGICASSGSACLADSQEPSHVIKAMKPDLGSSRQSVRFSLGHGNTEGEVNSALKCIARACAILRG